MSEKSNKKRARGPNPIEDVEINSERIVISNGKSELVPDVTRLLEITKELEIRKKLYSELDELIVKLQQGGFESAELDDLTIELKDNFLEKNTGWTAAAVRRFDVELKKKKA